MTTEYKNIDGLEKVKQIGFGFFIAFILASGVSIIAPWLFSWTADFFNPTPHLQAKCQLKDFTEKPFSEYLNCWDNSNSYEAKIRRLRHAIPWFWIALIYFSWVFLKDPLNGRVRDDSGDIVYEGEILWEFLLHILFQIFLGILIWVFLSRSTKSIISLGVILSTLILWAILDKYLLKKYGKPKSTIR